MVVVVTSSAEYAADLIAAGHVLAGCDWAPHTDAHLLILTDPRSHR